MLDIDSHASIWDGCKMGDAEVVPFKHNDISAMEKASEADSRGRGQAGGAGRRLFDAGRHCPLKEMIPRCQENGAMVLVDEGRIRWASSPPTGARVAEQGAASMMSIS